MQHVWHKVLPMTTWLIKIKALSSVGQTGTEQQRRCSRNSCTNLILQSFPSLQTRLLLGLYILWWLRSVALQCQINWFELPKAAMIGPRMMPRPLVYVELCRVHCQGPLWQIPHFPMWEDSCWLVWLQGHWLITEVYWRTLFSQGGWRKSDWWRSNELFWQSLQLLPYFGFTLIKMYVVKSSPSWVLN